MCRTHGNRKPRPLPIIICSKNTNSQEKPQSRRTAFRASKEEKKGGENNDKPQNSSTGRYTNNDELQQQSPLKRLTEQLGGRGLKLVLLERNLSLNSEAAHNYSRQSAQRLLPCQ